MSLRPKATRLAALIALTFAALATTGCDRKKSSQNASPSSVGDPMNANAYAKMRAQAVEQYAGARVTPVTSSDELVGDWEMRFGGPVGSNKIEWTYGFKRDGTVTVGDEVWRWSLGKDGTLSFIVTTPPDPTSPGLEEGATTEERRYVFKAQDGRVVLSNEDTSVIELLTKTTAGAGGAR